jgi:hypothetical protein
MAPDDTALDRPGDTQLGADRGTRVRRRSRRRHDGLDGLADAAENP